MRRASAVLILATCSGCVGSLGGEVRDTGRATDTHLDARREDTGDVSSLDVPAMLLDARPMPLDAPVTEDAWETTEVDEICRPWRVPTDEFDQSVVPLEVEPLRASSTKIVLVAGRISGHPSGQHEYFAGMALFARMLCQTPGVVPVIVRDGWPSHESVFENADAIVFYADGRSGHPLQDSAHRALIQTYIDRGVGFGAMHYAVDYDAPAADVVRAWLGGTYEDGYSTNFDWDASYASYPVHPITRGMAPYTLGDEWYHTMHWASPDTGLTALLQAVPPDRTRNTPETMMHLGRIETTAWAYERPDGGRSFGFTGGHYNDGWFADDTNSPNHRRFVTNAMLWIAGVEVPVGGAPVAWDHADDRHWKDRR